MWRGLYIAASGMITETKHTDMIANNLANADTTGFKRDDMAIREFAPMLLRRINDHSADTEVTSFKGFRVDGNRAPRVGTLGLGSAVDEIATEHLQGALHTTGNTYDLGISGPGYFAVDTPQGVRYTRDGSFYRSANGELQNVRGQAVLSSRGRPIQIPDDAGNVSISSDGRIYANGGEIAQIGFFQFGINDRVTKQGDNLYRPQEGARASSSRECSRCRIRVSLRRWSNSSTTTVSTRQDQRRCRRRIRFLIRRSTTSDVRVKEI